MRYELEKAKKELEIKKDLLKKKNKEIRMLRERFQTTARRKLINQTPAHPSRRAPASQPRKSNEKLKSQLMSFSL